MEDLLDNVPDKIAAATATVTGLLMDFKNADKKGKLIRIAVVVGTFLVIAVVLNMLGLGGSGAGLSKTSP